MGDGNGECIRHLLLRSCYLVLSRNSGNITSIGIAKRLYCLMWVLHDVLLVMRVLTLTMNAKLCFTCQCTKLIRFIKHFHIKFTVLLLVSASAACIVFV